MIFFIALSLSMDALSLSLAYGSSYLRQKDIYLIPVIVGLFHFFMPIIGTIIGTNIFKIIRINPSILVGIILIFIGINMCTKKEEELSNLETIIQIILFALAVSLDSFSVGIGLKAITNHIFLASFIFCTTACIITYLGLKLGNIISNKIGKYAPLLGGICLIIIGVTYII